MRLRSVLAASLALVLAGCLPDNDKPATTGGANRLGTEISITTWNLQWFPGKVPGTPDPGAIAAHAKLASNVLVGIKPDILCVQEIKDPEALGSLTGPIGHSVQVVSNFRGNQEVAILSRFAADAAFMEPFTPGDVATPPRGFSYAAFRFGDHVLAVYSVHLKSNSGGADKTAPTREESARQLVTHANEMTELYRGEGHPCTVVVAGDFNHDPGRDDWADDDTLRILLDAGFSWTGEGQPREETVTWLSDGRFPDAAFDHILVRAAEGVEVGRATTAKTDRAVSDHRPLTVALRLPVHPEP